jgi:hypothetical protein
MSPRWNWDSPTPLAASECALPPGPKGGGAHSPAAKGVGESQFQRLEKRLALCLLCGNAASKVLSHSLYTLCVSMYKISPDQYMMQLVKSSLIVFILSVLACAYTQWIQYAANQNCSIKVDNISHFKKQPTFTYP